MVLDKLKQRKDWFQVYEDEDLAPMRLTAYHNLRTVYEESGKANEDFRYRTNSGLSPMEIKRNTTFRKLGELKEKDGLLSWIGSVANFAIRDPSKPSNSSCTVPPTHKSSLSLSFFHFLSKAIRAIRICQFRTDLLHWRT